MDIWPTSTSRLVTHMAGVTNTAHDVREQARPSDLGVCVSATVQNTFGPSMIPSLATPPPPAGWAMTRGRCDFDASLVPQAMAPPQAAMAATWGQRTCTPTLCGSDGHAPAPAKRSRTTINPHLLLDIQALGPDGIRRAGGLVELARQHHVSFRALTNLILEKGTLTARGQAKIRRDVLELPTKPIPGRLLQELSALGPDGIKRAGGVGALALKHDVSCTNLRSHILESGRLTAKGQNKIKTQVLELPHQPIPARLLQELSALGTEGIHRAGGLGALALQHDVSIKSLLHFMRADGRMTATGRGKIQTEVLELPTQPITGPLLQELSALGPDGIQRAGGVGALALEHGVSVRTLQSRILETGRLTAKGQNTIKTQVLELPHQPITAQLLLELSALGPDGIKRAGGLGALALKHDVSVNSLHSYILETGRLTESGQDKINIEVLGLQHQPITGQLLQALSALGPDGIQSAGGVGALALQHGVSVNSLHSYILETGRLTATGQDKINIEVLGMEHLPITGHLLQKLSALGPDGIQRAGGVGALALQHGVSVIGLHLLIRETGHLTAKGQAKIQSEVLEWPTKPITGQLLQELSALGPGGIKRAGGVAALSVQHGVSIRSLQKFILETGRLTALGQEKINCEVHGLATQPITAQLLQELSALGPDGIKQAGGVGALALQHGVSVSGLLHLILETGRLTAVGQDKINTEVHGLATQPITGRLLQELTALGPDGIQRAGGLGAWALKHGVSVTSLRLLIRENGSLTKKGQARVKNVALS
jgi:hypothetical protein